MKLKNRIKTASNALFLLLSSICFLMNNAAAQTLPLPYEIINSSEYSDDEIYVGLVGKIDGTDVWIDMATGDINEMKLSDNTLQGPINNGNKGPGGDGKYADNFTRLSDIPGHIVDIPQIYAVRIFISFKSPLYLYFFGDGGGYSAPSLSNNSDPNLGLKYELVELTYGDNGLWTNTTRVDAYQYPMGLEVWGTDGFYKRVGEVLTHEEILNQWQTRVSNAFQGSLDKEMGVILNPSKSNAFQKGEAYNDYFSDYVNAVWARYADEDMYLSIGEAGVWVGRVKNDQFIFTNQSDGTVGLISDKPNTLEILEASGVLAEDVASTPSIHADQNVQKHFSAAFNRGAIDLNAPVGELLEWSNLDTYFGENTHNEYVAFWHSQDISFEGETYAFAYDDVFDYSSTIQSTVPERVKITIGGFVNTPYIAPASITLSSNELSLDSNDSAQLTATLLPKNADNKAVIWKSSDTAVATVTNGLIKTLSTGTAVITVSSYDGTVSSSAAIEVNGGDYSNSSTIRIEAEDYTDMFGIETEATNDGDAGINVGWIDAGDYMEYELTIPAAGLYTIAYRIASIAEGASLEVQVNGKTELNSDLTVTGTWNNWDTQIDTLTLPEGNVTIRIIATGANWNINWLELTLIDATNTSGTVDTDESTDAVETIETVETIEPTNPSTPIDTDTTLQSTIHIEAEAYTAMEGIETQPTNDDNGVLNVGWIDANDYMEYDVTIPESGLYSIAYRISSVVGDSSVDVQVDGITVLSTKLETTGSWGEWYTQIDTLTLPAGDVTIRLSATGPNWNLNWIELTPVNSTETNNVDVINSDNNNTTVNNNAVLHIEAEDYTLMEGIETQPTNDEDGVLNVGWIDAGDYMEYELTVPTAGSYSIAYRIASVIGDSSVDVLVNGNNVLSTTIETTESWGIWYTQMDTINLPAGDVTIRLAATGPNWNLNWFELTPN